MSKQRILIIEDDKNISELVEYNLEKAGFDCETAVTGEAGFEFLSRQEIDLVILDIMLPKMDGFEVCKMVKQNRHSQHIPIIMLTAKGEEVDRIVGFELGADDYVVKPFSPRELVLRVKAILGRSKSKKTIKDILTQGKLKMDIPRHRVFQGQKEVKLTQIEFKLLAVLMQRRGTVQTRDKLLNDVWDIAAEVTTRTIDTHIKRLRQKLGKSGKYIETVRGLGYRFSE
jgi:two-component system, OmpR family, phosphate regulon response regulator PhoB